MDVVLPQTVVLIGELPGSLVYHLVLLFALQTALAVTAWRRVYSPAAGRLAWAAGLSALLVLASLAATLLAALPLFNGQPLDGGLLLPPLARSVDTLLVLLWLWAAAFPHRSRPADAAALGVGLLVLLAAGVTWVNWSAAVAAGTTAFNGTTEDTLWGWAQVALTGLGLLPLLARRPTHWPLGVAMLLVLLAGQILHVTFLWPDTSLPGTVRLTQLIAVPLFAALVQRRALADEPPPALAAPPVTPAEAPGRRGLDPKAAVALASLNTSSNPDELAQIATLAVAHACRAELCVLISPPDNLGMCSLTCAYDLSRQQFIPGTFFSAADMPALRAALTQNTITRLTPADHAPELRRLSGAAGLGPIGPTLIAPLFSDKQRFGALAVVALYSHREWAADDQALLGALVEPISEAFSGENQINRLGRDLAQAQARLETAEAARRDARSEADQLSVALEAARDEAERLNQSIGQLRQTTPAASPAPVDDVAALRATFLAGQTASLADVEAEWRARLETTELELEARLRQVTQLEADLEAARDQAQDAAHHADQLRAELEPLRANLPALAAQSAELDQLRAELAGTRAQPTEPAASPEEGLALLAAAQAALAAQSAEVDQLRAALAAATPDPALPSVEQLQHELDTTRAELRQLSEQHAELVAGAVSAAAFTEIQQTLAYTQQELAAARADLAARPAAGPETEAVVPGRAPHLVETRQLTAALDDQTRQLAEAQAELEDFRAQLAAAQDQVRAQAADLARARAQFDAQTNAQAEVHAAQIQLAEALEQLRVKEDDLAQAQRAAASLDAQARQLEQIQPELTQLRSQLADAQDQARGRLEALVSAQQQIAALTAELAAAQGAGAELQARTDQLAAAQTELTARQAQWTETQTALHSQSAELSTAQAALTELQSRHDQLNAAQADAALLQTHLTETQAALQAKAAELAAVQTTLAELQTQSGQAAALQTELAEARAAAQGALADLQARGEQLTAVQMELTTAQTELAETHAALQGQAAETAGAQSALAALQTQLADTQAAAHHQTAALAAAQAAVATLQGQLELFTAAQTELTDLRAQLTDTNAALAGQEAELAAAVRAAADLQAPAQELAQLKPHLTALRAQLAAAEQRWQAQSQELTQAQEQLRMKESELARAMAALAELATQTHTLTLTQKQLAEKERQLAEIQVVAPPAAGRDAARPFLPEASVEVIASLSQEVRQPMSAIVGYSDLLLGESVGILGALQRKFLERIKASCERMETLLNDLIRVTDIDSGDLQLVPESVDVLVIVEDAILSCAAQFREKGINLRLDIGEQLPAVSADRDALRQVIGHLLTNAGAASGNDGDVVLKVRAEMDPSAVDPASHALLIAVRDSGGGVAAEDQPRVFQRFYRADAPLIAGLGETGVGLSVAKALVEAHGGRIWLTSEPGQGSTFTVLLPMHSRNGAHAR